MVQQFIAFTGAVGPKSDSEAAAFASFANVRKEEPMAPSAVAMGDTEDEKKLFKAMKEKGIRELPPRYPKWQKAVRFPLKSRSAKWSVVTFAKRRRRGILGIDDRVLRTLVEFCKAPHAASFRQQVGR